MVLETPASLWYRGAYGSEDAMSSVAGQVLDFYDDVNGEQMTKIAMPVEVQNVQMTVLDSDERDRLPNTEFGLVVLTKHAHAIRKFPLNDPGNSFLSAKYFEQNHEKLAMPARFKAASFIKRACAAYQVPSGPVVDAYAVRAEADDASSNFFVEGSEQRWMLTKLGQQELLTKQAAAANMDALINMPDGQFALVVDAGDGTITRRYAMPDGEHVKKAEEYFDKYAMQLEPAHRHMFASSVKRRAAELSVPLTKDSAIEKWASEEWNDKVDWHLEARKQLLPHDHQQGSRKILEKLAASLNDTTPVDMAKALEKFDQGTGLDRYYGKGLADPYASTMGKAASAWSDDEDGQIITEADLRKIPTTKIAGYLGSAFAGQFERNPVEVFESLPKPEKVLIRQLVSGEA